MPGISQCQAVCRWVPCHEHSGALAPAAHIMLPPCKHQHCKQPSAPTLPPLPASPASPSVSSSAYQTAAAAAPAPPRQVRCVALLPPPRLPLPLLRHAAAAAPRAQACWAPGSCGHSRGSPASACLPLPHHLHPARQVRKRVGSAQMATEQGSGGGGGGGTGRLGEQALRLLHPTFSISTVSFVVTALAPRSCWSRYAAQPSTSDARCAARCMAIECEPLGSRCEQRDRRRSGLCRAAKSGGLRGVRLLSRVFRERQAVAGVAVRAADIRVLPAQPAAAAAAAAGGGRSPLSHCT